MKRSAVIIFCTVFLLAAVVTGGLYWRWVNSPRYALQQMVLAIQTRNLDKFYNYMDLKEISANLVDASSEELTSPESPDMDELERLGRRLGKKVAKIVVPKLLEKFEKQIKGGIEQYLLNLSNSQVLALAAAVTTADIKTRGETAEVTLQDPKTGGPLRFRMLRDPTSKQWRIVTLRYEDLKRLVKRELL
jgi:hypothetical protein